MYPTMSVTLVSGETPDLTLIGYGGMAPLAIEAAKKILIEDELMVEILIPSLVKPVPFDDFFSAICKTGRVLLVEEGVMTGGWGAEVAAQIHAKCNHALKVPVARLAAEEVPIPSSRVLEDKVLPSVDDIVHHLRRLA